MRRRVSRASGFQDHNLFGDDEEEDAAGGGADGMDAVGGRIEVVAGLEVVLSEVDFAIEDEDLFASGVGVGGVGGAGLELEEEGGRAAGGGVAAEDLDGDAGDAGFVKGGPVEGVGLGVLGGFGGLVGWLGHGVGVRGARWCGRHASLDSIGGGAGWAVMWCIL